MTVQVVEPRLKLKKYTLNFFLILLKNYFGSKTTNLKSKVMIFKAN